jgi:hypothetical protein
MTNSKAGPQSNDVAKNFTLHVEWDGGGEATLQNPEWRMKGDAPDKQGRVSHRDAKVNHLECFPRFLMIILSRLS